MQTVKLITPGKAGARGLPGPMGVSAISNLVNPILTTDRIFTARTELSELGYQIGANNVLTYSNTLILRGLTGSTVVLYIDGPAGSTVSGILTSPYAVAPEPNGNSLAFAITTNPSDDMYIIQLSGTIVAPTAGRASVSIENIDGVSGGYITKGSFAHWSNTAFSTLAADNVGNVVPSIVDSLMASNANLANRVTQLEKTVNTLAGN
jgi:hypothetical protein